ncbi:MAG: hypothetical protein ORO03_00810 [Alphaproteobacteria bacterium]|nr:hypothetical protein [Alphaproteobacteria bacterium]
MIVLCTGMIRSASNWSYNAARLLLAHHSENLGCGYSDDIGKALKEAKRAEHILIKTHRPDLLGRQMIQHRACLTLHSFRNPLEALASSVESFSGDLDRHIAAVASGLDILQFELEVGGVHFLWYPEIVNFPLPRIAAIADYFGIEASPEILNQISKTLSREQVMATVKRLPQGERKIPIGGFEWKNSTLMRFGQIRQNPKTIEKALTPAQIKRASAAFANLTQDNGELLDLVKNIGCLETYYHQGRLYRLGEEPAEDSQAVLEPVPLEAVTPPAPTATPPETLSTEDEPAGIPILSQFQAMPDDFDPGFYITEAPPQIDYSLEKTPEVAQLPILPPGGPPPQPQTLQETELESLAASGARPNPARLAALGHAPPTANSRPRGIPLSQRRPGINEVI